MERRAGLLRGIRTAQYEGTNRHALQHRSNVYPILSDARMPEKYKSLVSPVDVIYCDVAQPQQAKILADNADLFLKSKGFALIAIKSRSVDVTMEPPDVFKQEIESPSAAQLRNNSDRQT